MLIQAKRILYGLLERYRNLWFDDEGEELDSEVITAIDKILEHLDKEI